LGGLIPVTLCSPMRGTFLFFLDSPPCGSGFDPSISFHTSTFLTAKAREHHDSAGLRSSSPFFLTPNSPPWWSVSFPPLAVFGRRGSFVLAAILSSFFSSPITWKKVPSCWLCVPAAASPNPFFFFFWATKSFFSLFFRGRRPTRGRSTTYFPFLPYYFFLSLGILCIIRSNKPSLRPPSFSPSYRLPSLASLRGQRPHGPKPLSALQDFFYFWLCPFLPF